MLFVFVSGLWTNVNAKTLFADDFEGGLSDKWVIANQDGEGEWKVTNEKGNKFLQKTGETWSIISVDGIASLKDHKKIWATARIRADSQDANEGVEVGPLIKPNVAKGDWYYTIRAQSGETGFDQLGISWHALKPYKDWEVGERH